MLVGLIILGLAITGTVAWLWAGGIDYMAKHHPDYKGEDWLDWNDDDNSLKDNIL